ncbi:MAG: 3-deoxy-D-manno-octulosonic acid transferase [Candidatus Kapaibacterium sp.]
MNLLSIVYNALGIPALEVARSVVKPFNAKLRERESLWEDTVESLEHLPAGRPRLWVHAASMGEFEQAKPVIERVKNRMPDLLVICSFYSPSGMNTQRNYPQADGLVYMPFDRRSDAMFFIKSIAPDAAVFVRYEIWRNHLELMKKLGIPSMLIDATRPGSAAFESFAPARAFLRSSLNFFDNIYTVGPEHTAYFERLGVRSPVQTLSDTRADRIADKVGEARSNPLVPESLFAGEFCLVAGSVWPPDEEILIPAINKINVDKLKIRAIFVPHEPTEKHIKELRQKLGGGVLLSQLIEQAGLGEKNAEILLEDNHIIVDSIGKLLKLYAHADAAYIGGAFGDGVHSVTEPAGYGVPLAAGPSIENSPDAPAIEKLGALTRLRTADDAWRWLNEMINDREKAETRGRIAGEYVTAALGASDIIAEKILRILNK